jgi:predicted TIM-barrel fold metal-dependent hydrolase
MANGTPIIDAHTLFGFWPSRKADLRPETLVSLMKKNGIAKSLVVSATGILYDFVRGNDEALAFGRQSTDVFPLGTLDPKRHVGCAEEIDKRAEQGFKLFSFYPQHQGWPLDFLPFQQILDKLAEKKLAAMVYCGGLGAATQLTRMCKGGAPVILSGVSYGNLGEVLAVMKDHSQFMVESHMLNTPDGFEVLCGEVGADRVVFGSLSPLKYLNSALMPLKAATLTDEERAKILSGNIRRILSGEA